jgi:sulfhydrogenase subunit alpha
MKNLEIKITNVTRVEGHGNITVSVKDGEVKEARLDISESPRFFEVMLQGRKCTDAAWITSRICGICAVAHTTASLRATEDAFGITPSEQTLLLRRLIFNGEVIQSHVLHTYFLVAPDLLGAGSVIPLVSTHGEVVVRALRLKKLANDLCAVVGGRHLHPVSMAINGFTKLPDIGALKEIQKRLIEARADMTATVELFKGLRFPDFIRETEYISLSSGGAYEFISGDLKSSDGYTVPCREYQDTLKETVLATSSAKHVRAGRDSFMVGALARFNNSHTLLHPKAAEAAAELGLAAPCHNPFMINIAQLVETVHCLEDSISLIDLILEKGLKAEDRSFVPREGRGVGIVEAPRGALIHDYTYGPDGRVTAANCIIPTGQNLANIDMDMRSILPSLAGMPEDGIAARLKMLVRAYDPCISCATHDIEVVFRHT